MQHVVLTNKHVVLTNKHVMFTSKHYNGVANIYIYIYTQSSNCILQ